MPSPLYGRMPFPQMPQFSLGGLDQIIGQVGGRAIGALNQIQASNNQRLNQARQLQAQLVQAGVLSPLDILALQAQTNNQLAAAQLGLNNQLTAAQSQLQNSSSSLDAQLAALSSQVNDSLPDNADFTLSDLGLIPNLDSLDGSAQPSARADDDPDLVALLASLSGASPATPTSKLPSQIFAPPLPIPPRYFSGGPMPYSKQRPPQFQSSGRQQLGPGVFDPSLAALGYMRRPGNQDYGASNFFSPWQSQSYDNLLASQSYPPGGFTTQYGSTPYWG